MANNPTNTSIVKTNVFSHMVKDTTDIFMSEGLYTHAIHAINKAHYGEKGAIGNEPSNEFCTKAPYSIIGAVYKTGTEWVLFSTNNTNSEIGLFDEQTCSYTKIVRDECLDFHTTNLITGVCKENYDCTWSVYWQDGRNPDRVLNLENVPYIVGYQAACQEPVPSNVLDCDALRLHPLVEQPCIKLSRGNNAGQLTNGSYFAVIAYSENGIRLTDYSMPSNVQSLWQHVGIGGSLNVEVNLLDSGFNEFELVVVGVVAQQTIAKKIGNYPITYSGASGATVTNTVTIPLDQILQSLPTIDLGLIPMKSVIYEKSDKMFAISDTLIRCGVTSQPYFNYQPLANQIVTEWVAVRYPANYYWNGGVNVGYMRDEVYAFFIRWVYKTGARSASFHIPGRDFIGTPTTIDREDVSGDDVLPGETKRWQAFDTSTFSYSGGQTDDGGTIYAKGRMGYWESGSEFYPADQPEVWGDLCNKRIRHHKMPSNETIQIHKTNPGTHEETIYVLGVEFKNILPPLNEDGEIIDDIVGYEILRGSREGNKTILAKGLFNNMWEYTLDNDATDKKGLFQNYPYNDLHADPFLTDNYDLLAVNAPAPDNSERLTTYRKDTFSFHSPDTNIVRPYLGANYVKLYSEEYGTVKGNFSYPYMHPQFKIISNTTFASSLAIGVGIGLLAAVGKTTLHSQRTATAEAGVILANAEEELNSGSSKESGTVGAIFDLIKYQTDQIPGSPLGAIALIATLSSFGLNYLYYVGQGTDETMDVIRNLSKWRDYVLQYNSHGFYSNTVNVTNPNIIGANACIKRKIPTEKIKYIGSGIQDFDSEWRINNLYRNKYVCLQTTKDIPNPVNSDNTKQRVTSQFTAESDYKEEKFVNESFNTTAVSYYGAIKVNYENQYGQLDSIVQIPVASCVVPKSLNNVIVFGGDTYINRYTEKSPYFFFNTWMIDLPNGTEFNYRNYVNGPAPRFWVDTNRFDMSDFAIQWQGLTASPPITLTTPSDFHRLDTSGVSYRWTVKYAYSYLFYNGVRDFYTESELNIAYRDYGEEDYQKFYDPYGASFNDIDYMFRSDVITKPIYYKYDLSLSASRLFNNFATWGKLLPRDYNPTLYDTCFEYFPRRVIYSLQQQEGLRRDNWRNFLPLNYKDFSGRVSTMKSLNTTGAIILFEDAEPVVSYGIDQLQTTSGVKFTIGDGELFQQNWQSMVNADDVMGYGECTSSRSAVNTPYGLFWVSQKNGTIMHYVPGSQPWAISNMGLKYWFAEHLPSKLLEQFPDYPHYDNPVMGIGCQAVYDPQYELMYFTKKDYVAINEDVYWNVDSFYIDINDKPQHIQLTDTRYFEPCNWVASFDPTIPPQDNLQTGGGWISFHLWNPSLLIPSYKHFFSVNDNEIWRHNDRTDSYCVFYDTPYQWEVEYPIVTPNNVTSLRSVEYYLDCYTFFNDGRDAFHILDENFDRCIIYNSEQNSGLLRLQIKGKNAPLDLLQYPQITGNWITILYSKEENKFRFDKFWDTTRDRGEFSGVEVPMWDTSCNGVVKTLNPAYVNYAKSALQRKKFRHYGNRIILRKNPQQRQDIKMVLKLTNTKELQSFR